VDVRLESFERVRKRWNLECHLGPPLNDLFLSSYVDQTTRSAKPEI
ncbi:MAG: hypothetical protein QOI23_788, partial [Chloroflexota bacterium]|nr:hypothetical protein [Chloroflexota bacterium]